MSSSDQLNAGEGHDQLFYSSIFTSCSFSGSTPAMVVAVDFGTTFSGFAYVKPSLEYNPLHIKVISKWPGDSRAGAKAYCKNQTSLFYTPSPSNPAQFELQDWGWSAFYAFSKATSQLAKRYTTPRVNRSSSSTSSSWNGDALNMGADTAHNIGYFAYKFKLYLHPQVTKERCMPPLPGNLTADTLVVDYLTKLTEFIIDELRMATGRGFSKEEVQWCLTVPAIWDEQTKQIMRNCAEKAGMVKGPCCPEGVATSSHPLQIILEAEAASAYCQDKAKALKLVRGDRILVADVGGGTIDLVVHEVVQTHPTKGITQVREVVSSYGDTGGGTYVDARFFELLCEKIGCFIEFCYDKSPSLPIQIYSWWQGIKTDFDGPGYNAEFSLANSALGEAWQKYDIEHGMVRRASYYQEVCLNDTEIMSIFDPEVDKLLQLIEKQVMKVRVLMVVGGFAGSFYLRKQLLSRFGGRVEEIIIPDEPGSAICRGAVQLYTNKGYIKSRISKKTYGICTTRLTSKYDVDIPQELLFLDDFGEMRCRNIFSAFVRAGTSVELNASKKRIYGPIEKGQKTIDFPLYSSPRAYPKYTTEHDAKLEGRFKIDISEGIELGTKRNVEVTMVFGDSLITVSAARLNFGTRQRAAVEQASLSVKFEHT